MGSLCHNQARIRHRPGPGRRVSKGRPDTRGQVMLEYVIITGILIGAVAILSVFLHTFKKQSVRVLNLVVSEYP